MIQPLSQGGDTGSNPVGAAKGDLPIRAGQISFSGCRLVIFQYRQRPPLPDAYCTDSARGGHTRTMKNSSIALPTDTRRGSVVAVLATCGDRRKPPPSWSFALPPMTEALADLARAGGNVRRCRGHPRHHWDPHSRWLLPTGHPWPPLGQLPHGQGQGNRSTGDNVRRQLAFRGIGNRRNPSRTTPAGQTAAAEPPEPLEPLGRDDRFQIDSPIGLSGPGCGNRTLNHGNPGPVRSAASPRFTRVMGGITRVRCLP